MSTFADECRTLADRAARILLASALENVPYQRRKKLQLLEEDLRIVASAADEEPDFYKEPTS